MQDAAHNVGRKWSGDFAPIENVYNFPGNGIHLRLFAEAGAGEIVRVSGGRWRNPLSHTVLRQQHVQPVSLSLLHELIVPPA